MPQAVTILPTGPTSGEIRPPGSKSITNRALICAALARGTSRLTGALDSEDTQVMIGAWNQLGIPVRQVDDLLEVEGCGGMLPLADAKLYIANSGTSIRFLTAALCACQAKATGSIELDGVERMRERPISDLLDALNRLGATVESINGTSPGCPPVRLSPNGIPGGKTTIRGDVSSQYLSGLMMAAPLANEQVHLQIQGHLVSVPYVKMTSAVMNAFGCETAESPPGEFLIPNTGYQSCDYEIEPDASAASYFWGAAAITAGEATVLGLNAKSLQGDVGFCHVLEQMGCTVTFQESSIKVQGTKNLVGINVDMADISDTVQTLASVALFADGPTRVRGVAHNRVKETDRIGDLATELRKLGAGVQEFEDGLEIHPPEKIKAAQLATYHDHRMAMSLALVGLRAEGIKIEDPACTAKTYPNYWKDLAVFSGCGIS